MSKQYCKPLVMIINKSKVAYCVVILFLVLMFIFTFVFNKNIQKTKIIGIVPDYDLDTSIDPSARKFYNYHKLRDRYIDSFEQVCKNTTFILLPISESQNSMEKTLSLVDGIIITGGDDINGKFFNQDTHPSCDDLEPDRRTIFTLHAVKYAMKNNKGVLGICNGMQAINIANGGNLIQDIPSMISDKIPHKDLNKLKTAHDLSIVDKNSFIFNVLKKDKIAVNSAHHQAVGEIGSNLSIVAKADDDIVEAIECNNCSKPIIGVQWHPEFLITDDDVKLIKAFCDAI